MREPAASRTRSPLNIADLRARLAGTDGPRYWKGLEQLAETEEFREYLSREFPEQASEWHDGASRREFLKLMAASLALAGVSGCAFQPPEEIVPYVRAPEELVQGKPLYFATSMTVAGDVVGILAESHEGRPTKLEGNSLHPAVPPAFVKRGGDSDQASETGAAGLFAQAEILTLYDPDRSQSVLHFAVPSTWESFQDEMLDNFQRRKQDGRGAGLRLLTPAITSPTVSALIQELQEELPGVGWHQYEPVNHDHAREGAIMAFGKPVDAKLRLENADVIVSLDRPFLTEGPGHTIHARDFADRRDPEHEAGMNRLYVVETNLTVEGAKADHRMPLTPSEVKSFAAALATELGLTGVPEVTANLPVAAVEWIGPVVRDLKAKGPGRSVILAGESQDPVVHALAHAMNDLLGNVGPEGTIEYLDPVVAASVDHAESLQSLVDDINAGEVDALIMLGVNPAYDAPADLDFANLLLKTTGEGDAETDLVPLRVHLGEYLNETGELCHWHIPLAHSLESWGDARAFDGTVSLQQPLIEPLYGGKSIAEVVAALLGTRNPSGRELLEGQWKPILSEEDPEASPEAINRTWRAALHDGIIRGTAAEPMTVTLRPTSEWLNASDFEAAASGEGVELLLAPDPTIFDGRYANNAWLQECPKPLTKLTWDNALMVPPSMVDAGGALEGLESGDVVSISIGEDTFDTLLQESAGGVAIWVMPGHADNAVTLHLGYGRRRSGRVGKGIGFNAYVLRTTEQTRVVPAVTLTPTRGKYQLVSTQIQRSLEGRELYLEDTFAHYRESLEHEGDHDEEHGGGHHHGDLGYGSAAGPGKVPPTLYPDYDYSRDREATAGEGWNEYPGYAWGMTVDLSRCIGCAACTVACQAENNIPVVGKREVSRGRIMHWMEVDRYYSASVENDPDSALANPSVAFQPRFCMHCEKAPCEPVCPVGATVHDHEGLNNMVYNRCVGTRYCSNNCPYKVRRFNFLKYSEIQLKETSLSSGVSPMVLQHNPDVTVRPRGVMEKCTYCTQRIQAAKIQAELEDRLVQDGEILTACQSACPANALVFGDLNDVESEVYRLKATPRNFGMLAHELNTRPRTTYLKRLTNPNPELETA